MVTIKDVVDALRECLDPELGANVVDMGLVYDIRVENERDVKVKMSMTSPMCPLTAMIVSNVQTRLGTMHGVGKVDVELTWDPAWNPEMMISDLRPV